MSNSILDKPGSLTRAEFDRVELHPMLTEQMLRRSPALGRLNAVASTHHERLDGSGYHKGLRTGASGAAAHLLAATDVYVGLTSDRADRPAFIAGDAAGEVRRLVGAGALTPPRPTPCWPPPATGRRAHRGAAGPGTPGGCRAGRPRCSTSPPAG